VSPQDKHDLVPIVASGSFLLLIFGVITDINVLYVLAVAGFVICLALEMSGRNDDDFR
jgi:hypothetical protein